MACLGFAEFWLVSQPPFYRVSPRGAMGFFMSLRAMSDDPTVNKAG
jgi:hypothetical protein